MSTDTQITPAESMIFAVEYAIRDMVAHRCIGTETELLVAAYLLSQSATQLLYKRVEQNADALKVLTRIETPTGAPN